MPISRGRQVLFRGCRKLGGNVSWRSFLFPFLLVFGVLFGAAFLSWADVISDGIALYEDGRYGDAYDRLMDAARQGQPEAAFYVGLMLEKGQGVSRDEVAAADWYLRAAEAGHAEAAYRLAGLYEYGMGVDRDYQQAADYYAQAATLGHADADYCLRALVTRGVAREPTRKVPAVEEEAPWPVASIVTPEPVVVPEVPPATVEPRAITQESPVVSNRVDAPAAASAPSFPVQDEGMTNTPSSSEAVPTPSPASGGLDPALALRAAVGFRADCITNFVGAVQRVPGGEHVRFLAEYEPIRSVPFVWSYFMAGSVLVGGEASTGQPVIAFYSPVADVALVTSWTLTSATGCMLSAASIWGGTPSQGTQRTNTETGIIPLYAQLSERLMTFAKSFPKVGSSDVFTPGGLASQTGLVQQAAAVSLLEIRALQRALKPDAPECVPALSRIWEAIGQDRLEDLYALCSTGAVDAVFVFSDLPADIRKQFTPALVVPLKGGAVVHFNIPGVPQYGLELLLDESAAKPVVEGTFFDLMPQATQGGRP